MIVADTSGLLAFFNANEPRHRDVERAVAGAADTLLISPYVVAELDYLVGERIGTAAECAVLRELAGPAYELADINAGSLEAAVDVIERYADRDIGVTDASLVVLADRYRARRILTLDHRHFDTLRGLDGEPFELLP